MLGAFEAFEEIRALNADPGLDGVTLGSSDVCVEPGRLKSDCLLALGLDVVEELLPTRICYFFGEETSCDSMFRDVGGLKERLYTTEGGCVFWRP